MAEIRPIDPERHLDELATLILDAHASNMALGLRAPLDADRARDAWRGRGDRVLLGAFAGEALVGSVTLARAHAENGRHRGEVQRLAVRTSHRGRGIGGALLEAAIVRARADGLTLLWLTTHADTDSDRFYVRRGWTRYGVVPGWAELPDGTLAANAFFYLAL
ncbi:MAG TPA: GNAT family N-acetyltransferase [Gaiellaceae bacterium]